MNALATFHADIKHNLGQANLYTACRDSRWSHLRLIMHVDSVVNQWLTTAADGNLPESPTGSQTPKQWRPCHG